MSSGRIERAVTSPILVDGDPALTEDMVRRVAGLLSWGLETRDDPPFKARVRDILVGEWRGRKQEEMRGTLRLLEIEQMIAARPRSESEFCREAFQLEMVKALREGPADPDSRWLLSLYDAAHPPLTDGPLPLTRKAADALLDYLAFMAEKTGRGVVRIDVNVRDRWARAMAAGYPKLSRAEREGLTALPRELAAVRVAWKAAPEWEREKARGRWRQQLAEALGPDLVIAEAETAAQRLNAFRARMSGAGREDFVRAARDMLLVAEGLRRLGGPENLRAAAEYEENSRRTYAVVQRSYAGAADYETAVAAMQRRHNDFIALSNLQMASHAAMMNVGSNISGSPYVFSTRPTW